MKNLTSLTLGLIAASLTAQGAVFTFTPRPADLGDLDHRYYYYWTIDVRALAGQHILSAELTLNDVSDTDLNPADILHINLVDVLPSGPGFESMVLLGSTGRSLYRGQDVDDALNANQFAGNPEIGVLDPPINGSYVFGDVTFEFDAELLSQLRRGVLDGRTGIGFDPDCHFQNSGVSLVIRTPDGGTTLALMGLGLLGVGAMRRWFVSR